MLLGSYLRETSKEPFKATDAWRLMSDIIKRLLRFGLPTGVEPFLNWVALNVFVQSMHSYSLDTAAAGDTTWVMGVSIAIHWSMAVAAILLARVAHAHQYVTWFTLILMNLSHATSVFYRFRTGRWREMELIG